MEKFIIHEMGIGIIGWFIVILLGSLVFGMFRMKNKSKEGDQDHKEDQK